MKCDGHNWYCWYIKVVILGMTSFNFDYRNVCIFVCHFSKTENLTAFCFSFGCTLSSLNTFLYYMFLYIGNVGKLSRSCNTSLKWYSPIGDFFQKTIMSFSSFVLKFVKILQSVPSNVQQKIQIIETRLHRLYSIHLVVHSQNLK